MTVKKLRPGVRFMLWKLFHPRKWKRRRELFRNLDEMHNYKAPGLENLLVQSSTKRR